MLGLAACQNEPEGLDVNVGGEQAVTINVAVPETETRAGGLNSALGVFDNGVLSGDATMRYILQIYYGDKKSEERLVAYSDGKSVAFDVRLVPERTYQFVVWADVVDTAEDVDKHYNTADLTNVTLNNTWIAMDETRDAFTTTEEILFNGNTNLTLNLTRPFAKLRVVTTDMEALNNIDIEPKTATVEYTTAHRASFNAVEGTFAEASMDKTHNFEIASYGETGNAPRTLFTDYFFADNETVNFILTVNDQNGQPIVSENFNTDIYVKRNHLTTIKGGVLTDSKNFTITVEDSFATPEIEYTIWDGKTLKEPTLNDTTGNYEISQGSQLAWLAAAVSGTLDTRAVAADSFAGKTFALTQDIDLGDHEWKPIGMGGKHFEGTFDGQGHTIKGLRVTKRYSGSQAALFCSVAGTATIKNLIIDGAYVKYPADGKDYYGAALVGTAYGHVTIENVTVQNSHITGNNKVAAIIAHDGSSNSLNIDGCVVDNCYIATEDAADGGNVGGVMGLFQTGGSNNVIKNTVVKNCEIVAINSANAGKRANSQFVGGTISKANQTLVIENCSVENNTYTETFVHAEGVADYVGGYDNKFVGGDRDDKYLGVVIINGTRYEGTEEPKNVSAEDGQFYATIDEAVKAGNEEVTLGAGEFNLGTFSSDVTIKGVDRENTIIVVDNKTGDGKVVNFENVTVTRTPEASYRTNDMETTQENYTDCIINGCVRILAHESATFTNCQFYNDVKDGFNGYSIHYYAYDGSKLYVNNCTFNTVSKGICIYNEGVNDYYLEVNDCTFTASEKDDKAAIQMHTEYGITGIVKINNTTATGFADVNGGLWNELNNQTKVATNNFDIIVDGVIVKRAGYTEVANYPSLFTKDGNYYVFNAEGLMSLNSFFEKNKYAHATFDADYYIGADIDATGCTWNKVSLNVPNNNKSGFTFDGQNHTISNLNINGALFNYTACGSYDEAQAGEVNNITFDNATVTGAYHTGVVWGCLTNDLKLKNVHVINSNITGTCNVGGLIGSTGEGSKYEVTFDGCSVKNTKITANGENVDPTGASGFIGRALNDTTIKFVGSNVINGNTITNNNGLVGGNVYGYAAHINGAFAYPGFSDEFVNWYGLNPSDVAEGVSKTNDYTYYISNKEGLLWLANQVNVEGKSFSKVTFNLTADIDLENDAWTPIGQTGGNGVAIHFTGSLNGNGHTISNLYVTPESSDYSEGANYAAGLFGFVDAGEANIRNLTIDGANVHGHHWTGAIAGYLSGEITNCTVKNSTITCSHANDDACGDKAGTVTGYINSGKVYMCHAENCTVKAGRDAGQIVGASKVERVVDCTATNVTVEANGDCTGANVRNDVIGRLL